MSYYFEDLCKPNKSKINYFLIVFLICKLPWSAVSLIYDFETIILAMIGRFNVEGSTWNFLFLGIIPQFSLTISELILAIGGRYKKGYMLAAIMLVIINTIFSFITQTFVFKSINIIFYTPFVVLIILFFLFAKRNSEQGDS